MTSIARAAHIAAVLAGLGFAGSAMASTTYIDLGASSQNYVLYGQGPVAPGVGSFTNQQGDESYNAITNVTTDTLSGLISGSTDALLGSGSYTFVTTYTGTPIGSGGQEIISQSNPSNVNGFYFDYFDASVQTTLYLTGTPSGNVTIPLVTNGAFTSADFYFYDVTAVCTGVASCSQNNVGLTLGATQSGPVTISVSETIVPEPATWAMMLLGVGLVGASFRRRGTRTAAVRA